LNYTKNFTIEGNWITLLYHKILIETKRVFRGRNSSVGTATQYWLDGPGIESRWGRDFSSPVQTSSGTHPASCTMSTGIFPEVKWPGRGADHPSPSMCRDHERVELYLYSHSGPSWPVIGRTNQPNNQPHVCSVSWLAGSHIHLKQSPVYCGCNIWCKNIINYILLERLSHCRIHFCT